LSLHLFVVLCSGRINRHPLLLVNQGKLSEGIGDAVDGQVLTQ